MCYSSVMKPAILVNFAMNTLIIIIMVTFGVGTTYICTYSYCTVYSNTVNACAECSAHTSMALCRMQFVGLHVCIRHVCVHSFLGLYHRHCANGYSTIS